MSDIDWANVAILLDVIHKSASAGAKYTPLATEADFLLGETIGTCKANADDRAKAKAQAEAEARAKELARQQDLLDKQAVQDKVNADTDDNTPKSIPGRRV